MLLWEAVIVGFKLREHAVDGPSVVLDRVEQGRVLGFFHGFQIALNDFGGLIQDLPVELAVWNFSVVFRVTGRDWFLKRSVHGTC